MENFFIDGKFYNDLSELMDDRDIQDDELHLLDGDWCETAKQSKLEKIFTLKKDFVVNAIIEQTDTWEERFPEDSDDLFEEIKKAVEQGIDLEKMNNLLPELYYPDGVKFKITKQDLIDYCA